mmetsp:Transcript_22020/g.69476  ORF Transcript_22020/g.69476 Transcript_22020/m.69476 type:complete len:260 (+) Transcript_22020:433-1212(+)
MGLSGVPFQQGGLGAHPRAARRQAAHSNQGGARGYGAALEECAVHLREHGPEVLLAHQLPRDVAGGGVVPHDCRHAGPRAEEDHPQALERDGRRRRHRSRLAPLPADGLRLPRDLLCGVRGAGRCGPPRELPGLQEHGGDDAGQGVLRGAGGRVRRLLLSGCGPRRHHELGPRQGGRGDEVHPREVPQGLHLLRQRQLRRHQCLQKLGHGRPQGSGGEPGGDAVRAAGQRQPAPNRCGCAGRAQEELRDHGDQRLQAPA